MRRVSASNRFFAGAFAVVMMVSAPAVAFAAENVDGDESGQLNLNATVLVNESIGVGSTGDFAIRGRLFSAKLDAKTQEQREAAVERLRAVETLDFAQRQTSVVDYQPMRSGLFEEYKPQNVLQGSQENAEVSPALFGIAAVVAVPLVLVGGVLLGRFWARRKRVSR